jgi:hypothetical protein
MQQVTAQELDSPTVGGSGKPEGSNAFDQALELATGKRRWMLDPTIGWRWDVQWPGENTNRSSYDEWGSCMCDGDVVAVGSSLLQGRESQDCQPIVRQEETEQADEVPGAIHYRCGRHEQ